MDTATIQRQLRIKTGSVTRNMKDYVWYFKEKSDIETLIHQLGEQEGQERALRRHNARLQETLPLIPDAVERTQAALLDLEGLIALHL